MVLVFICVGLLIYYAIEVTNENRDLKTELNTIKDSSAALRREYDAAITTTRILSDTVTTLRNENANLRQRLEAAQKRLEEMGAENEDLLREIRELEAQLNSTAPTMPPQSNSEQSHLLPDASKNVDGEAYTAKSEMGNTDTAIWALASVSMTAAMMLGGFGLYNLRQKRYMVRAATRTTPHNYGTNPNRR
jgi:septal ring factor EnvC (AmiA/AmiB activator)